MHGQVETLVCWYVKLCRRDQFGVAEIQVLLYYGLKWLLMKDLVVLIVSTGDGSSVGSTFSFEQVHL